MWLMYNFPGQCRCQTEDLEPLPHVYAQQSRTLCEKHTKCNLVPLLLFEVPDAAAMEKWITEYNPARSIRLIPGT